MDLSQKNLRGGENLKQGEKNERGEEDGNSLILFNGDITQSQFCP
jgi:hypothetical protein